MNLELGPYRNKDFQRDPRSRYTLSLSGDNLMKDSSAAITCMRPVRDRSHFLMGWLSAIIVGSSASTAAAQEIVDPGIIDDAATNYAIVGFSGRTDISDDFHLYGFAVGLVGDIDGAAVSFGIGRNIAPNTFIRAGYFGAFFDETVERPSPRDQRARLELHWSHTFGDFRISHRSRLEHRFLEFGQQTRYRPELALSVRATQSIEPFVSVEPFYVLQDTDLATVLTQVGSQVDLTEKMGLRVSYARGFNSDAPDLNIGLATMSFSF